MLEKKFGLSLNNYQKDNIELDLIGKKNNICNIIEIKHRNQPADYEDVQNFLEKVRKSEFKDRKNKLFFISKYGFTEEAENLAKRNNISLRLNKGNNDN